MALVAGPCVVLTAVAASLRFFELARAGTVASIAGDNSLRAFFPILRVRPVLIHGSIPLGPRHNAWVRLAFAAVVIAVVGTYEFGARLYGRGAGLLAILPLAVMPDHVAVSRRVSGGWVS